MQNSGGVPGSRVCMYFTICEHVCVHAMLHASTQVATPYETAWQAITYALDFCLSLAEYYKTLPRWCHWFLCIYGISIKVRFWAYNTPPAHRTTTPGNPPQTPGFGIVPRARLRETLELGRGAYLRILYPSQTGRELL